MSTQSLTLRAQELINRADGPITAREALKQALIERYGNNVDALADAAAGFATSIATKLRKATYDLPEPNGLFDVPSVISNNTVDGVLLIHRDEATVGQTRQWLREASQYHATQRLRFERATEELALLDDVDDAVLWIEARRELGARVRGVIEQ
jgi:hypothetical protein